MFDCEEASGTPSTVDLGSAESRCAGLQRDLVKCQLRVWKMAQETKAKDEVIDTQVLSLFVCLFMFKKGEMNEGMGSLSSKRRSSVGKRNVVIQGL